MISTNPRFKKKSLQGCGPRLMNAINLYSKWVFILGSGLVCAEVVSVVLSTLTIFYIKRGHSIRFECIKSEESTTALTRFVRFNGRYFFFKFCKVYHLCLPQHSRWTWIIDIHGFVHFTSSRYAHIFFSLNLIHYFNNILQKYIIFILFMFIHFYCPPHSATYQKRDN